MEAAGLRHVAGEARSRLELVQLEDVAHGPGRLIRHHGAFDPRGHRCERLRAGHRLLAKKQAVLLLAACRLNRLRDGPVTLVAVDADLDLGTDRLAESTHELDVTLGVETGLALDRPDPLADGLLGLGDTAVDLHDPQRVRDFDAVPLPAAEQLPDGHAECLPGQIVAGHVDGRLRVRVALYDPVHSRVHNRHLGGIHLADRRQQIALDDVLDRLRGLSVVAHVRAAPGRDRRRLPPARTALVRVEPDDCVVADRSLHLARPGVLAPRGNGNQEYLAAGDLHDVAPSRTSSPASENGS